MGKKKTPNPCDLKGIEEWMIQFLQDPFTSFLDDYTFRVDLFETSTSYIVEAYIENKQKNHISIEIKNDSLTISVVLKDEESPKERTVILPFYLEDKWIEAKYEDPILEVKVLKEGFVMRQVNTIPIHPQ